MFKRFRSFVVLFVVIMAAVGGWWWWQTNTAQSAPAATLTNYLSAETPDEAFARATEPGDIQFPKDLGPHPDYQTEWWYYTGNLTTADGRQFGYQFTIFRRALTPAVPQTPNAWRTNQIYFAHFAVSDIAAQQFYAFEKFSRGAADLAGAQADPYHVWIEDWQVRAQADGSHQITAVADGVRLDLNLTQTRPPVLHGQDGLSVKGGEPGNASYYYSLINQTSVGTVTIGDEVHEVTGHSWKDHEYSTSALDPGAVGWDWFSLQFDNADQNALMYFNIRRADGTLEPQSSGSWILPDGSTVYLTRDDVQIEVLDTWTSPDTAAEYPIEWRIRIPKIELDITGRALMPNQELTVSTIYWEGAVSFEGTLAGEPVSATGYIEMTGYGQSMAGRI